ncbi:MAG: CsgG/HfaB family protein [Myxococcales bacterium]
MLALLAAAVFAAAPAPVPTDGKPVLTVLYFDNQTGQTDLDVLRKGLADMIITDLVAWDGVRVVERERLESVIAELKLQRGAAFDQATVVKLGRFLGAQYTLTGTLVTATPGLSIVANLRKAETAEIVASASVHGPQDKVFDLEQELVDKITAGIDLKVKNLAARRKAKVPDLASLVAYSVALDLTDQGRLDEASKAIQALVSKQPAFLMARERKTEILKKLDEVAKRRLDMATESVLELGRRADAALKDPKPFDTLDEKGQKERLGMRVIKGRVIARVLKQYLSWRKEHLRIPLKGKEAQAMLVMRGWVDNQRALVVEYEAYQRLNKFPSSSLDPTPETVNLMRDGHLGDVAVHDPFEDLVRFVTEGRLSDSDSAYRVAPTFGDLDPKELKAVMAELDERIQRALAAYLKVDEAGKQRAEHDACELLERKAESLLAYGKTEEAIAEYQRLLDAFPNGHSATNIEKKIKQLIGAEYEYSQANRERWVKAMKEGCADDMDLRVGTGVVLSDRLKHQGLAALASHAAELEKACKRTPRNHDAMAGVYRDLAMEAAFHEDCAAYQHWFTQYAEAGGSVGDMMGYAKNHTPWCELGDVTKKVMWMYGKLDKNWSFEFDRHLVSILAYDGKRLTLNAGKEAVPESFSLYLDADAKGEFTVCHLAQWHRAGERDALEGKCTVQITRLASQKFEYDEGSFTATFEIKEPGYVRKMEMTDAKFRLRRE